MQGLLGALRLGQCRLICRVLLQRQLLYLLRVFILQSFEPMELLSQLALNTVIFITSVYKYCGLIVFQSFMFSMCCHPVQLRRVKINLMFKIVKYL